MKTKTIKQAVSFKAEPHEVYEALMDSKKHSEFTGDKAVISGKVGGKWSAFGGYAEGVNLKLVPDRKIVQTWRSSDFDEGYFSKVTFDLVKTKTGTKLTFKHEDVPSDQASELKQGWIDYYWEPMKKYFA
jgi:activator of HSP90 ATPase